MENGVPGSTILLTKINQERQSTMIAIDRNTPGFGDERPVFEPGQVICHRRYGYRGVIVDRDARCMADEAWYKKNQTQPDQNQPWYHVLVDQSTACTYVASQNLVADPSGTPIDHPLLQHFFSGFKDGHYVRNDEPWPG